MDVGSGLRQLATPKELCGELRRNLCRYLNAGEAPWGRALPAPLSDQRPMLALVISQPGHGARHSLS